MLEKIKRGVDPYADADATREALTRLSKLSLTAFGPAGTFILVAPGQGYVNGIATVPQANTSGAADAKVAVKGQTVATANIPNPTTAGTEVKAGVAAGENMVPVKEGEAITITTTGVAQSVRVLFQLDV